MENTTIWKVERIDKAGVLDPHKQWLVRFNREKGEKRSDEAIRAEVETAKQLVRDFFDDEYERLEDDNWSLTVEIVEFEHGDKRGRVCNL